MKNGKAKGLKQINNTSNKGLFRLGTDINTNDYHVLVQNKKEKKTYEMPFSLFNTGGGGGIESIVEGTNITIDDTDPQNPIISATGGGTPAGSDTQIQYNNAGSFGADAGFTRTLETFNVGFEKSQRGNVDYTGPGSGIYSFYFDNFNGTLPTTYTINVVDNTLRTLLEFNTNTLSGGQFSNGDTIDNGSGSIATVLSVQNVDFSGIGFNRYFLIVNVTSGSFSNGDTIDNGSGVTAILLSNQQNVKTVSWTDGSEIQPYCPIYGPRDAIFLNQGIALTVGFSPDIGGQWTWTYSESSYSVIDLNNSTNTQSFSNDSENGIFGFRISDINGPYGSVFGAVNYLDNGLDINVNGFIYEASHLKIENLLYMTSSNNYINETSSSERKTTELINISTNTKLFQSFDTGSNTINFHKITDFDSPGQVNYGFSVDSSNLISLGVIGSGGNNTKITIDDVNEQITISNLSAYDDDTAAGVGGLTAGMVYMTTGSGSAPLNAAGILMIKQ